MTTPESPPIRCPDMGTVLTTWLRRLTLWQWLFALVVALYVWHFTNTSIRIHHGLGTSSYDFALYDQGTWLLSRFKAPFVTLMGRNLFGDHTSFIMVFFVPFYWLFPGPNVLLFLQTVGLAAGAIPVFLYARRRFDHEAIALVVGGAFLLHPSLGWTNVEQFHPDAFLPAFVGFAVYFALTERWRPYAVFVILALLVKEDVAFVIVPLGLWVALKKDRRYGLATAGGAILYMAFAMAVVMRLLAGEWNPNAWRVPFGGVAGFIGALFTDTAEVVSYLTGGGRPWYLLRVAFPFAFMFLLAPLVAAISSLTIGANVISTFEYQSNIRYHYTAVALPALGLATVGGIARTPRRWHATLAIVVLSCSALGAYWWGTFPFSLEPKTYWSPRDPIPQQAAEMFDLIPDDAIVSAHHGATAHLAHREHIYMFPNPFSTVLYGDAELRRNEGQRLPIADEVEYVMLPRTLPEREGAEVWEDIRAEFTLHTETEHWRLWVRR